MIRALWAAPRTVSTAFERMMIERGDHLVLDEPWSRAYYFGPDRRSDRYPLIFPESTYEAVTTSVLALADHERDVFVKDMAYQAGPGLDEDALARMDHTFLIREPVASLASLRREWPDASDDEVGVHAQRALFDRVRDATGAVPTVIDSDMLRADPHRIVAHWCQHTGLDHRPESLTWSAGMRPEWQLWRPWYENAAASTGFAPPTTGPGDPGDPGDPGVVDVSSLLADHRYLQAHAIA